MVHFGSCVKVWQLYFAMLLSTYQITGGFVQIVRDITLATRRGRSAYIFDPISTPYGKCHSSSSIHIEKPSSSSAQALFAVPSLAIADDETQPFVRNILSDGQSYLPKGTTENEFLYITVRICCCFCGRRFLGLGISPTIRKNSNILCYFLSSVY